MPIAPASKFPVKKGGTFPVLNQKITCSENTVLGRPFFIMTAMPGQAQARKLVRSPGLAEQGLELVAQLGQIMAKLHSITPQKSCLQQAEFI